MHDILPPDEIKRRCKAINVSPEALAREAGVAPSTVRRLGARDTRSSTCRKLSAALKQREATMFRHLFTLYRDEPRADEARP